MAKKYVAFLLFALTMPIANFMIANVGTTCIEDGPCLIPVGFGLLAPSGVLLVGVALVLRDWLQEITNWRWSIAAIATGAALSWLTSNPYLAFASAASFFVAESLDLAVYTPLRKAGKHIAVLASGLVGAAADSMLFVYLAFGSLEFSAGNTLGKIYATLIVSLILYTRVKYATLPRNTNNP